MAATAPRLGRRGHVSAEELLQALKSEHAGVRRGVAEVLGAIASVGWHGNGRSGRDVVVTALAKALDDPDSEVRVRAARALGQPGLAAAVPALIGKLTGSDEELRSAAAESLGNIGRMIPVVVVGASPSPFVWLLRRVFDSRSHGHGVE